MKQQDFSISWPAAAGAAARILWRDATGQRSGTASDDRTHLDACMAWLGCAHDAANGKGVATGYHLVRGWAEPYPETTGYLIPTFLRYANLSGDTDYAQRAQQMAEWELEVQLPSGAIPGRTGRARDPVVFDTGQVIFGWLAAAQASGDERFLDAARHAGDWLLSVQDTDGAWRRNEFLGIAHAYCSRVAWALLALGERTEQSIYTEAAHRQLEWVLAGCSANGWIDHMSFDDRSAPFTHTIAYTLEGLWESATYADADLAARLRHAVQTAWQAICDRHDLAGSAPGRPLPGQLDTDWSSHGRYVCLTGNAQMALVGLRLYQVDAESDNGKAAIRLLDEVKRCQYLDSVPSALRGAIAGSSPHWGRYLRFWYPNWAAKFFCDALMQSLDGTNGTEYPPG